MINYKTKIDVCFTMQCRQKAGIVVSETNSRVCTVMSVNCNDLQGISDGNQWNIIFLSVANREISYYRFLSSFEMTFFIIHPSSLLPKGTYDVIS